MGMTVWRICVQIFYVVVVLFFFAELQGRLEMLIVSLAGLLYVTIRLGFIGIATGFGKGIVSMYADVLAIKAIVSQETVQDGNSRNVMHEAFDTAIKPVYFEYGGLSVISMICLFNAFAAFSH